MILQTILKPRSKTPQKRLFTLTEGSRRTAEFCAFIRQVSENSGVSRQYLRVATENRSASGEGAA